MIKKIGATLLLISNASFASTASLNGLSFDLNQHEADKFSNLSGDFGFQASDLVDDVGEVAGNKHFGFMNVKYQSYNSANYYKGLSISSQINNEEVMQYSIKEALIEHRGVNSRLAIGRTNLDWSHADEIWGLGKVNNRINFDYFEPGQEGLVGIFYDIKSASGFELGVFGSFLYIPELNQGLIVDKKNRSVACKTMWCDAPLSSAEIEGKNVPIHYDVNYPDTSKVVNRVSAGLKLGFEYKSFYINSFYMRKPENTMSIIAEVSVESDLSEVTAEVTPQFYNHDVRGGNIELKLSERFKLYGSYISVVPEKSPEGDVPFIEYTGIKPKKKKEDYASAGALFNNGDLKVHTGYIARVSEFDTESDVLVDYPRWNQAMHLALSKNISRKISVALDVKYDMLTEDRLTMFQTDYRFGPSIVAAFGVKMIGTNQSKESYWSKYENNDSVYSSLKYAF